MRYSVSNNTTPARAIEHAPESWLLLLTTYGVIASGVLLMAVAEQTVAYLFIVLVLCAAHVIVVGPRSTGYLSGQAAQVLAVGALAWCLFQVYVADVHLSFAAAHFLILVQLIKLYQARLARDLRLIQVVALFLAVVASIWSVDLAYLPVFLVAALCMMANLMAAAIQPLQVSGSAATRYAGEDTAPIGIVRFAWLLAPPAVIVLVITAGIFVLLPRSHGVSRASFPLMEPVTGFSENVSLREVGMLRQSNRVALRVQFFAADTPDRAPWKPGRLLMRGTCFPVYRDGQWYSYAEALRESLRPHPELAGRPNNEFASRMDYFLAEVRVRSRHILQRVTLELPSARTFFALYRPVDLRGTYETPVDPVSHKILVPFVFRAHQTYEVESLLPQFTAEQLRQAVTPDPALPWISHWTVPERIQPVLRQTVAEIERLYSPETDYDRIVAAMNYLTDPDRFRYTLELADYGTDDPVVAFLTKTRRGSCEHFSSALALILRMWDIPTRLVIGFKEGEYDSITRSYVFRDKDAHAWVEAYFDHLGWVEFDPAPTGTVAAELGVAELGPVGRFFGDMQAAIQRMYQDARLQWGAAVIGYGKMKQERILSSMREAMTRMAQEVSWLMQAVWPDLPQMSFGQMALAGVLLTFVAMLFYLLIQRLLGAAWKRRRGGARGKTVRFYEDMLRMLRRRGWQRPPHTTPREFAQALSRKIGEGPEGAAEVVAAIETVTELYYRVRFGNRPLAQQEAQDVQAALHLVKRTPRPVDK